MTRACGACGARHGSKQRGGLLHPVLDFLQQLVLGSVDGLAQGVLECQLVGAAVAFEHQAAQAQHEVTQLRLRPTPFEFEMYYAL